ncbi:MAG TPA: glycosyltransferase family 1 protein [Gemmatimonadaceae bacterium]|nr:glycosyltransferase family 1 protein [Gemmatimonadaceae bacterium]
MRIAITLQSLDETWGGIGVYTKELVPSLLRADPENEYVLLYPGFGAPRKRLGQFRRFPNVLEVETTESHVPSGTYWDQRIVPAVARRYGVDVLFNPFMSVPIRGKFGKVLIMHNVEYHTVPNVYDFRMFVRWKFLERVILPSADRVISISQVMTDDFAKCMRYPIDQVRTIYHGVSDRFRRVEDPERLAWAREQYVLPERFLLFVGNLYPQKNFATLARAFAALRDEIPHKLVVAGRPRWKYDADLELIERLGIRDRVEFLQFVPHDDLPLVYSMADAFIYPSLYESFGLAQLEAMACGCPVIGARSGAIPEICGDAALLFEPKDDVALAAAIRQVLGDDATRAELVRKGYARAKEFTWARCAEATLDVMRELGGDSRSVARGSGLRPALGGSTPPYGRRHVAQR